jgi:hypothetical protein
MKKILLFTAFVVCFAFAGCSKNDDSNGIIGKWELVVEYEPGVNNEWEEVYEYDPNEVVLDFRQDGRIFCYEDGEEISNGDYVYNKSKGEITITIMYQVTLKIEALTQTRLIVYNDEMRIVLGRL